MRSTIAFIALAVIAAPLAAAQTVQVSQFQSVELRGGGIVTVRPGPEQRVTLVEGDRAITKFAVAADGRLTIEACDRSCPANYKVRVDIQAPVVPSLRIAGGGEIVAARGFGRQRHLAAAVSGAGSIDLRSVDAASFNTAIMGGGRIATGSSSAVNAAINGGGLITYAGNPRVSTAIVGGGAVKRAR